MLIVAEYYVGDISLPGTHLFLVPKGSGFAYLAQQIEEGRLSMRGIRILVSLIGRREVLDRTHKVEDVLAYLRQVLN